MARHQVPPLTAVEREDHRLRAIEARKQRARMLGGVHEDLAQDAEAMSEELRPCPFCGGKAVYRGTGQVYVRCLACGARSRGTVERYRSNLAALWNMRTEDRRHEQD